MIEPIPALDILDGRCARLRRGDYRRQSIYDIAPLDLAKQIEDAGLRRLHLVDLDGARQGRVVNWQVLESIADKTSLIIDFGGGLRATEDLECAFKSGAAQVTIGSVALTDRGLFERWLTSFGSERIILAADVRAGFVAFHGWQEEGSVSLEELLRDVMTLGVHSVICTDIERDGMLNGPAYDLYRFVRDRFPELRLIASGGVQSIEDVKQLRDAGVHGVIIGKALYEGRISLSELEGLRC